jgi:hypothetical protein
MRFFDWNLWITIRRAKRRIRDLIRIACPEAKVFSRQYPSLDTPQRLNIWVVTKTDKERDRLVEDITLYQRLVDKFIESGYPTNAASHLRFVIQSQETLNRDYGGSWRSASAMGDQGLF